MGESGEEEMTLSSKQDLRMKYWNSERTMLRLGAQ